jgi:hypothetical protein
MKCFLSSFLFWYFLKFFFKKGLLYKLDIVSAGIQEENAKVEPKPAGHYMQIFLDRFGRRDRLKLLWQKYKTTQNLKYLQDIRRVRMRERRRKRSVGVRRNV